MFSCSIIICQITCAQKQHCAFQTYFYFLKFCAWLSLIQKLDFVFKLPLKLKLKNDFPTESGFGNGSQRARNGIHVIRTLSFEGVKSKVGKVRKKEQYIVKVQITTRNWKKIEA